MLTEQPHSDVKGAVDMAYKVKDKYPKPEHQPDVPIIKIYGENQLISIARRVVGRRNIGTCEGECEEIPDRLLNSNDAEVSSELAPRNNSTETGGSGEGRDKEVDIGNATEAREEPACND